MKIKVIADGPLRVTGAPLSRVGIERNAHERPVAYADRGAEEHGEAYSLCRCGASANKPFCDGSHKNIEWTPDETADRGPTAARRKEYAGEGFAMSDDKSLCWHAGFCVREHGHAWDLVGKAENATQRDDVKAMIQACPSSRLQYHEPASGPADEPQLARQVAILDNGPLYVQGGIPVEGADGVFYETLNRYSLCRCGASANKPYCDGTHTKTGFRDPE
jgi:CDGSH-type Zn-finger protein